VFSYEMPMIVAGSWQRSFFAKFFLNEGGQFFHGPISILALGDNPHGRSFNGGKYDHLHYAFPICFGWLFTDRHYLDAGKKLICQVDKLHRRPGMQAELVPNNNILRSRRHGAPLQH